MNLHDVDIIRMTKKDTNRDTARNLLTEGISIDMIAKCTGLSLDEVTALQTEAATTA